MEVALGPGIWGGISASGDGKEGCPRQQDR